MVMPNISDFALRGGYYRNNLNDTLQRARSVDYVLQGIDAHGNHSVFKYSDRRSFSYPSYELVDVRNSGVALMGNGWHRCEANYCWTRDDFTIEVHNNTPSSMIIELEYYKPPPAGKITVYIDDTNVAVFSIDDNKIKIDLENGYHEVRITSSWNDISPKEAGFSDDNRRLFAMVKAVRLI